MNNSRPPPHQHKTLVQPLDVTPRPKSNRHHQFQIGDVIDQRFSLEEELGQGGMGIVYKAKDLGNGSPVAIKCINEEFGQHPHAFTSLIREAEKTMALDHPSIVSVSEYRVQNHYAYLVMEFLEGKPWNELVSQNIPIAVEDKLAMLTLVAEGLAYAHSLGIVHSDLKPENLFYTTKKHVKILDFGLSHAIHECANEAPYHDNAVHEFDVTKLKAFTLGYASIERLEYQNPSIADDIFSFGVIACEFLCGTHPFKGKDALQAKKSGFDFFRDYVNTLEIKSDLATPELFDFLSRSIAFNAESRYSNFENVIETINTFKASF